MTDMANYIIDAVALTSIGMSGYSIWRVERNQRAIDRLQKQEEKINNLREAAYKKMADPDTILEDFEKGARAREMHDANRTTLPHPKAGQHAKVHRPKMSGKLPSKWNIPRV